MFDALTALCQPWADYYADRPALSTTMIAVHVVAMFIGGGIAIGADRALLRAAPGSAEAVRAVMADTAAAHTLVVTALVITGLSGSALFAADIAAHSASGVYWTKMVLIGALLANGYRMQGAERTVLLPFENLPVHTTEMPTAFPARQWRVIRTSAASSLFLWTSIVLLGVFVSNG